jgi:hypothetical protein
MPKISGPSKEKLTIGITPKNMKNIAVVMANNEYSTVTDLINDALANWFENRNKTSVTKEWMVSEEGREYIKSVMREVNDE